MPTTIAFPRSTEQLALAILTMHGVGQSRQPIQLPVLAVQHTMLLHPTHQREGGVPRELAEVQHVVPQASEADVVGGVVKVVVVKVAVVPPVVPGRRYTSMLRVCLHF